MIELLILWNVANAREELKDSKAEDAFGIIAVWVTLQILIWPTSMVALLRKAGCKWHQALIATAVVTTWGLWLGGLSFYFVTGMVGVLAAASAVALLIMKDS